MNLTFLFPLNSDHDFQEEVFTLHMKRRGQCSKATAKLFLINSAETNSMPVVCLYNFTWRHEKKKKKLDEINLPSGSSTLQWKRWLNWLLYCRQHGSLLHGRDNTYFHMDGLFLINFFVIESSGRTLETSQLQLLSRVTLWLSKHVFKWVIFHCIVTTAAHR